MYRATVVLPVFGRPERTKRMLECLSNQTISRWDAWIIGDACPHYGALIKSEWFSNWFKEQKSKGNDVSIGNLDRHRGGFGYYIINHAIKMAQGKYFMFAGNDDIIEPNHFEHYLSGIEGSDYDFVYYNSWIDPLRQVRVANLQHGGIGHSELIIRTEFLKRMPPHNEMYGHDWLLIQNMMKATNRYVKVSDDKLTYRVMSIKGKTFDNID